MADRTDPEGRDPKAPPSARHSTTAGPSGPASQPTQPSAGKTKPPTAAPFDPELAEDLGEELRLRGDQLEEALEAAKAEAEEWRDKAARAQADFENTKRRLEQRHADAVQRASERVVSELLPVLDDLERAVDHAVTQGSELADGLGGIYRKLLGVLDKEGASPIDPFGQPFDAEKHNAVSMREDTDVPDHTVVEVFQKGYEMHGRVLRPAMVVVSTGGPAARE